MRNSDWKGKQMKGYKGFNKDLTCRGKQYAENTVFEEETAEICKSGMHFCKNPFEVLNYYPFVNDNAEINEFAEVEALDECKTDDNEKFTTKKLKIGAKIGIDGLIKAFINFTLSKAKAESAATNIGDCSVATNTGDYSAASVEGKSSFAIATGINSKAKGKLGCYIAVAEWGQKDDGEYELINFKSHKVDGKTIKEDTYYTLKNGKFVEVKTNEAI